MSDKLGCACDEGIRAAANMGFAIAGVPCFADTFVQGGSSVLRMKFSATTHPLAQVFGLVPIYHSSSSKSNKPLVPQ